MNKPDTSKTELNESNYSKFYSEFRTQLEENIDKEPKKYAWCPAKSYVPPSGQPTREEIITNMATKLVSDLLNGETSKETTTVKGVCKKLKIPHTYREIGKYLSK